MQRVEERATRSPHQAAVLRARVGGSPRRARRRAARRRAPRVRAPPPAVRAPLPAAPADRARGGRPHREVGHRAQRVAAPVRGAGLGDHGRARRRDRAARGRARRTCTRPTAIVRQAAAEAVTAGLAPGLRTRAFVLNTLLADKAIDDRLRHYDSWIASRNLSNEASDESVQALVEAVQGRYSIPQRWYALKAQLLGLDRLADYDRMASVADDRVADRLARSEGSRARRVRVVLRRARRHRAARSSTAAGSTPRPGPGKRPGRVLRVHGAVAPSVRVAELDVAPARRADARARARPRAARVPRARAGRLPPDDAADARRDRVGVRRDRHVRAAARRGRPIRRSASRCSRRTSRIRSRPCSGRSR